MARHLTVMVTVTVMAMVMVVVVVVVLVVDTSPIATRHDSLNVNGVLSPTACAPLVRLRTGDATTNNSMKSCLLYTSPSPRDRG